MNPTQKQNAAVRLLPEVEVEVDTIQWEALHGILLNPVPNRVMGRWTFRIRRLPSFELKVTSQSYWPWDEALNMVLALCEGLPPVPGWDVQPKIFVTVLD